MAHQRKRSYSAINTRPTPIGVGNGLGKGSIADLKVGSNLLVKPKFKLAGNVPKKEIKTAFIQKNVSVLNMIRSALNNIILI